MPNLMNQTDLAKAIDMDIGQFSSLTRRQWFPKADSAGLRDLDAVKQAITGNIRRRGRRKGKRTTNAATTPPPMNDGDVIPFHPDPEPAMDVAPKDRAKMAEHRYIGEHWRYFIELAGHFRDRMPAATFAAIHINLKREMLDHERSLNDPVCPAEEPR